MKAKNSFSSPHLRLQKCLQSFYTNELYSAARSQSRGKLYSYFLVTCKSILMSAVILAEDYFSAIIDIEKQLSFLRTKWIQNITDNESDTVLELILGINSSIFLILSLLLLLWISSSYLEIAKTNIFSSNSFLSIKSSLKILSRQTRQSLSFFINMYIYIIQIPSLWISIRKIENPLSVLNLLLTLFLGIICADTDYSYLINGQDQLLQPFSLVAYSTVFWELLLFIIWKEISNSSLKILLVYYFAELVRSIYLPVYSISLQQGKVFQGLYFFLVVLIAVILDLFGKTTLNTTSMVIIIGLPISWKISSSYIQAREAKLENGLMRVLKEKRVDFLEMNYLMRMQLFHEEGALDQTQRFAAIKQMKQMNILLAGQDDQQSKSTSNNGYHADIKNHNLYDMGINRRDDYSKDVIKDISNEGGVKITDLVELPIESSQLEESSQTIGKQLNIVLSDLFHRELQQRKLSKLKGKELAIYFAFLVEKAQAMKLYWVYRKMAQQDQKTNLKSRQILESIEKQAFLHKKRQLEESDRVGNPFSPIYVEVLQFEKKINESYNLTVEASRLKISILTDMKSHMIDLQLLMKKIEQYQKLTKILRGNLNQLVKVNSKNYLLQELRSVYMETIAFNDKEISKGGVVILGARQYEKMSRQEIDYLKMEESRFNENTCVIAAQLEEKGGLLVNSVSNSFSEVFQTQKREDIIGKRIEAMIPSYLQVLHPLYVTKYLQTHQRLHSQGRHLFAQLDSIYISPISIDMRINTFQSFSTKNYSNNNNTSSYDSNKDISCNSSQCLQTGFGLCAKMTLLYPLKQYILFDQNNGKILGITPKIAGQLFFKSHNLSSLTIFSYISLLNPLNTLLDSPLLRNQRKSLKPGTPSSAALSTNYNDTTQIQLFKKEAKQLQEGSPVTYLFLKKLVSQNNKQMDESGSSYFSQNTNKIRILGYDYQFFLLTLVCKKLEYEFVSERIHTLEITNFQEINLETSRQVIVANLQKQISFLKMENVEFRYYIPVNHLEHLLKAINLSVKYPQSQQFQPRAQITAVPSSGFFYNAKLDQNSGNQMELWPTQQQSQLNTSMQSIENNDGDADSPNNIQNRTYMQSDIIVLSAHSNGQIHNNTNTNAIMSSTENEDHEKQGDIKTTERNLLKTQHDNGTTQRETLMPYRDTNWLEIQQIKLLQEPDSKGTKLSSENHKNIEQNSFFNGVFQDDKTSPKNLEKQSQTMQSPNSKSYSFAQQSHNNSIPRITIGQQQGQIEETEPKSVLANLESPPNISSRYIPTSPLSLSPNVRSKLLLQQQQLNGTRHREYDLNSFEEAATNLGGGIKSEEQEYQLHSQNQGLIKSMEQGYFLQSVEKTVQHTFKKEDTLQMQVESSINDVQDDLQFIKDTKTGNRTSFSRKKASRKQTGEDRASVSSKHSSFKAAKSLLKLLISNKSTPFSIKLLNFIGLFSFIILILTISLQYSNLVTQIKSNKEDKFYSTWPVDFQAGVNSLVKDNNLLLLLKNNDFTFSSSAIKTSFNTQTKAHLFKQKDTIIKLIAQTSGSTATRLVFKLLKEKQNTFQFGQYYDPNAIAGAPSIPAKYIFFSIKYNTTLHFSIILSYQHTFRYAVGLGTGRPEYYMILNNLNFHTALGEVQDDLLALQEQSDSDLQDQLTTVMIAIIVISAVCLIMLIPFYAFVQKSREVAVSLFATFEVSKIDEHIEVFNSAINHMVMVFPSYLHTQKSAKFQLKPQNVRLTQKNISSFTEIPRINKNLIVKLIIVFVLIGIYPIVSKIITQNYLQEATISLRATINLYEIKGYIIETIALHYNNLYMKMYPSVKPIRVENYNDHIQSLLDKSNQYQQQLFSVMKEETKYTRHNQDLYQQFYYSILGSDMCQILQQFPQYLSNSTILNNNDCQTLHKGFLKKGFQVALQEYLSIFPNLLTIYLMTNSAQYTPALTQFRKSFDLRDFSLFEDFLEEILVTLRNFSLTMSQTYYDYITQLHEVLFILQLVLLSIIFFFGWISLSASLNRQLYLSKHYLSILDIEFLLENAYILNYIKKHVVY